MDYAPQYNAVPQYGYPAQTYAPQQPYGQQTYAPPPYAQQPSYGYPPQYGYAPQQYYAPQPQPSYRPYTPPGWDAPEPDWDPFAADAFPAMDSFRADGQAVPQQAPDSLEPPMKAKKGKLNALINQEAKPDTAAKKILRQVTNIFFWIICIALVGGSMLFVLNKDPNKNYFGFRAYNVLTNSMRPRADGTSPSGGFSKGDTIIVQMCMPELIQKGDIVTFNPNPNDPESTAFLTHRVVDILDELGGKQGLYFVTKGDANKSEDPPIAAKAIIGKKVAMVPKVGGLLQLVRKNLTVSIVTIVALFGTILMLQWYFAKPKENPKKAKAAQTVPELHPNPIRPVLPG